MTTKTRMQGTIAHQAKIYAPHNLEISYYGTTIVTATLHNHKENTGNNSLPKQRTVHPTLLNYYDYKSTTLHIHNACNLLCVLYIYKTWKVLKCGAGEGWRRSVGPIM
jgi:hypothetical protein